MALALKATLRLDSKQFVQGAKRAQTANAQAAENIRKTAAAYLAAAQASARAGAAYAQAGAGNAVAARQAAAAQDKLSASAQSAGSAAAKSGRFFSAAAGRLNAYVLTAENVQKAIGALFSTLNEVNALDNHLRALTNNRGEAAALRGELFDLARSAHTGYGAMVQLYTSAGVAARQLGASQGDLLQFTETLAKAAAMSGASATQSNAAILRLSRGLASGALRGSEMRAILEQVPGVARAIADGLGVSVGELREMGAAGELSAQKVFGAVLSQTDKVRQQHEQSTPTIAQGWETLKTGASEYANAVDDATGFSDALAAALKDVGDALAGTADKINTRIRTDRELVDAANAGDTRDFSDDDISRALAAQPEIIYSDAHGNMVQIELSGGARTLLEHMQSKRASIADEAALVVHEEARRRTPSEASGGKAEQQKNHELALAAAQAKALQNKHDRAEALAKAQFALEAARIRARVKNEKHADELIAAQKAILNRHLADLAQKRAADEKSASERRLRESEKLAQDMLNRAMQQGQDRLALRATENKLIENERGRDLANAKLVYDSEFLAAQGNHTRQLAAWKNYLSEKQRIEEEHRQMAREAREKEEADAAGQLRADRDHGLGLARRRAALTPDREDDLAVQRDIAAASVDDREEDGKLTPEQAAEERAVILEEYRAALQALEEEAGVLSDNIAQKLFGDFGKGAQQAASGIKQAMDAVSKGDRAKALAEVGEGFNSIAEAATTSGQSVEDALKQMVVAMIQRAAQAAIEFAIVFALDAAATAFGAGPGLVLRAYYGDAGKGGNKNSAAKTRNPHTFHAGGIVGRDRGGPPRYHGGGLVGLKSNEVPAILERGEGVFTREQMAALAPAWRAPAMPAPQVNLQVQINNEGGGELEVAGHAIDENTGKAILQLVRRDIVAGGPTRNAVRQAAGVQ